MCNILIAIFVIAIFAQNDIFKLIFFTKHSFFKKHSSMIYTSNLHLCFKFGSIP